MGQLYEYLSAFIEYWWALLAGGLLAVDSTIEYYYEGYRRRLNKFISLKTRRRILFAATLIAVFLAGFFAWKDESIKVKDKQAELEQIQQDYQEASNKSGQKIESLEKQVATLQTGLREIKQKFAPRQIPQKDRLDFIKELASSGKYVVEVGYASGDSEALAFARTLAALFQMSGWKVQKFSIITVLGGPSPGVVIWIDKGKDIPLGASILVNLLMQQQIKTQIRERRPSKTNSIVAFKVFIGPKA